MEKRALSDIVSTVLIILLVVAAVAIIGVIVMNVVKNAGTGVKNDMVCQNAQITPTKCNYNSSSYSLVYGANLADGNRIANLTLILETKEGNIINNNVVGISSINNLETRAYSNLSSSNLTKFRTAYVVQAKDGSMVNCQSTIKLVCVNGNVAQVVNPVVISNFVPANAKNISSCQTITAGNYSLKNNIGTGGDCLTITVSGAVIYGNGFTINGNVNGNGYTQGSSGYSFNLINVHVTGTISAAGAGNNDLEGISGGSGGTITIANSTTSTINANGGFNDYDLRGGSGGTITIANSTTGSISSNGGDAMDAGFGGTITILYSNVSSISAKAGYATDRGGNGGTINIWTPSTNGTLDVSGSTGPASVGSDGQIYINGLLKVFRVYGCMDSAPHTKNYNPAATVDDGSCQYYTYGCIDSHSINYNPGADYGYWDSCYSHEGGPCRSDADCYPYESLTCFDSSYCTLG